MMLMTSSKDLAIRTDGPMMRVCWKTSIIDAPASNNNRPTALPTNNKSHIIKCDYICMYIIHIYIYVYVVAD